MGAPGSTELKRKVDGGSASRTASQQYVHRRCENSSIASLAAMTAEIKVDPMTCGVSLKAGQVGDVTHVNTSRRAAPAVDRQSRFTSVDSHRRNPVSADFRCAALAKIELCHKPRDSTADRNCCHGPPYVVRLFAIDDNIVTPTEWNGRRAQQKSSLRNDVIMID